MYNSKRPLLIVLASVLVLIQACTVEQNYYFKKDFSGTYELRIDMSSFIGVAGESFETDTLFSPESLREIEMATELVEGISNSKAQFEDNVFTTVYDFANLTALSDPALNSSQEMQGMYFFSSKGKTLKMKFNEDAANALTGEDSEAAAMAEMVTFVVNLDFEEEIKRVKGNVATWTNGEKKVKIALPMSELSKGRKDLDVEIQMK